MADEPRTYPRIILWWPGSKRYLVAIEPPGGGRGYGRILDKNYTPARYWPRQHVGTILVMTDPEFEDYTEDQDDLPAWLAAAQDMEAEIPPERRHWERVPDRRVRPAPVATDEGEDEDEEDEEDDDGA